MKNKIFFTIVTILILTMPAISQTTSLGLRGGLNMQNINGKDISGDALEMKMIPGFHIGLVVDVPIATDFWFQPGLLFSTKGAKSDGDFLGLGYSTKYNLSYIELPLNLVYKPILGDGHFFIGFGPYIGYAISGKATFEVGSLTTEQDITFEKEFNSSSDQDDWASFKRLDYGGNLFFGYQFDFGFSVQLNTQLGLAAINSENLSMTDSKATFRNTGFGLSLGYNF